jgi:hypothetical protein
MCPSYVLLVIIYVAVRQTIQNIDAIFTGDLSYDRLNIKVTRYVLILKLFLSNLQNKQVAINNSSKRNPRI